jgi:hypothetical protein
VLVSATVKDLVVGSALAFTDRGEQELKGVPGRWRLYAVGEDLPAPARLDAPAENMTAGDRLAVRVARRTPGALRAITRLTQR